MDELKKEINQRLNDILKPLKSGVVKEAMSYSLLAPGKRLRPLLFLSVLRSYGLDYHPYLNIACAIEMIHTYSLIHDDLPGMDNDDLRRGRPTCHKKFDEATAILAGDALLNLAVNTVLDVNIESDLKVKLLNCLYEASGVNGMIYGQQQDIAFENKQATLEELQDIHYHKTGELIAVSMQLASMVAHPEDYQYWTKIGFDLGLAFQVQDDVLDVIGDQKKLGKKVGSDLDNHKSTYVSLLGIDESQKKVEELFKNCYETVYAMRINHGLILELLTMILKRVN
ncbi:polyprenyl synthetase family protein [Candidatus Stoquefichus massiliensis]|uniref:polyprenyl synthetase family protein n=1 Tax=Candidatus Stoquefichus massiliensis TaxID=1470350 RepID=UPI0004817B26|nr:farnesyl diphosphate synthase [Candidatus Stoquefichus massiliensis]